MGNHIVEGARKRRQAGKAVGEGKTISVTECARQLGVHPGVVRHLIRSGAIDGPRGRVRERGRDRIDVEALMRAYGRRNGSHNGDCRAAG